MMCDNLWVVGFLVIKCLFALCSYTTYIYSNSYAKLQHYFFSINFYKESLQSHNFKRI
jgi:hypothetical protein